MSDCICAHIRGVKLLCVVARAHFLVLCPFTVCADEVIAICCTPLQGFEGGWTEKCYPIQGSAIEANR